jgi:hypothetical protein
MRYRDVMLSRGLVFFCIVSLLVLALFVVPAIAQDAGSGPPAGTPAPGSNPDSPSSPPDLVTIQAEDCRVSGSASVTLEDGDGTTARFVDGQRGIEITATANQISIEGPPDDFIGDHAVETSDPGFDTDGDYTVVSTTGISCQGTGTGQQPTDGIDGTAGDNNANAAETQYKADGKEVTVIVETIPDKGKLVDTGGPSLAVIGGVILAIGLVGLGIFLLRRT